MTNLHRSPPVNQSKTDLGIVNESQLLGFGITPSFWPIPWFATPELLKRFRFAGCTILLASLGSQYAAQPK
jgi:hypothetical protein